ncbi:MAG: DUF1311 domain-containing protein [Dechloromonas sp.]|nr:MAG: DUF1311 domain-containing protein [Dechloromonas sp.]
MVQQTTFLLACLACLSVPAIAADAIQACYDKARTQPELTHCSGLASQQADKELNAVYQAVLKRHKADRVFSEKFKAAQRAWLKWRDAEMEAIYPDSDQPQLSYGSSFSFCRGNQIEAITRERTKQIRKWADGIEEGELCVGSFPIRE